MKIRILLATALAVVVGLLLARPAAAQSGGGTKVAIVNVGEVFQKYQKAKFYKEELEKIIGPRKVEAEKLKNEILAWKKALDAGTVKKEDRPTYEAAMVANKRKLEDIERAVAPAIGKLQEAQVLTLFKDLATAVDGVAKTNGIHLVLAYGDVTDDRFTIANINRLMNGMDLGSTTPLFFDASVNITPQVIDALNNLYRTSGGTTGGPTGTPVSRPGM